MKNLSQFTDRHPVSRYRQDRFLRYGVAVTETLASLPRLHDRAVVDRSRLDIPFIPSPDRWED